LKQLLLATRNHAKLDELRRIVASADLARIDVVGLSDVVQYQESPETGATFEANALTKARDAVTATGIPAVADDSGISVAALNGMPGVLSARWAGSHGDDAANLNLLLAQLSDTPDERRGAAFVCAAAVVTPNGMERVVRGEWEGALARESRGNNGFGYDPIFVPDGENRTAAELGAAQKDAQSHRGRALHALVPHLVEAFGGDVAAGPGT